LKRLLNPFANLSVISDFFFSYFLFVFVIFNVFVFILSCLSLFFLHICPFITLKVAPGRGLAGLTLGFVRDEAQVNAARER
jgi:hypothetical protein